MPTFATLLARPGTRSMVLAGAIGRLPIGMVWLAVTLLALDRTGSYAVAGSLAAAITLGVAGGAPYASRLVDRFGQDVMLPVLLAVNAAATCLLMAAALLDWPVPVWFAAAAVAGASSPNLGAMTRSRWSLLTRTPAERSSAFAVESVIDELAFLVGPVLTTALALGVAPGAPLAVGMGLTLAGGLWLASQRRTQPPAGGRSATSGGHVLRTAGMPVVLALMLVMGGVFGGLQVSTVAFAQDRDPALTGVLLGAVSVGSLLSGVYLGSVQRTWSLSGQVRLGLGTLTLALVPLALVDSPVAFALAALGAGLSVSVVMVGAYGLVERLVPATRLTESLTVSGSGIAVGLATSTSVSGAIIDRWGSSWSFGLVVVVAAAGLCLASLRLEHLRRHEDPDGRIGP